MDVRSLISPTVEDEESLQTFFDALIDHVLTIERDVSRLKDVPGDRDVIAELFRAVHNIKGDASLCKVDFGIAIAHPIEGLLSRLRAGEVVFSDLTAEAILLATDRLELATDALLTKRPLDGLRLLPLVQGLEKMSRAMPEGIDAAAAALIESVTGFKAAASAAKGQVADQLAQEPAGRRRSALLPRHRPAIRSPFADVQGAHEPHPAFGPGNQPGGRKDG